VVLRGFICVAAACVAATVAAVDSRAAEEPPASSRFFEGGWLDISGFLDTAHGFVPLIAPITEPAVGYGAAGALIFIDRDRPGAGQRYARPNIGVIGGLATENGTRGLFGAHLGTWMDGRLRTEAGVADADVNLEFFGLGGDRAPGGAGIGYAVAARGGLAGGSYRLGDTPLWLGARYVLAETSVGPRSSVPLPGIAASDFGLRLAGVTLSLVLDMRDNFFTPTHGWHVDLSVPVFREALGGDRDFEKVELNAMRYVPVGRSLFLSMRGSVKASSEGTPFYLKPYVSLRGVQALRYQGSQAAEAEGELRWQAHPRFSLVGFAGAGIARNEFGERERDRSVAAGGAGFRYLIARKHGLHMGVDVARGPDQTVFYVVFGHAWLRP
jgi:hypothetical protein